MKALKLESGERPEVMEIRGDLESMQRIVGGLIQAVYPFKEPVALICNDEGKLLGLPLNRALRHPETGGSMTSYAVRHFSAGRRRKAGVLQT